jgi:hypothetical protein
MCGKDSWLHVWRWAADVELGNILTPGAVEDHFKVKEVLGVGRFGEVFAPAPRPPPSESEDTLQ